VIHVGGVTATRGTAALRELAETPEPLHFRLLVHDCSFAIGASGLDAGPATSDADAAVVRALIAANPMPADAQVVDQS